MNHLFDALQNASNSDRDAIELQDGSRVGFAELFSLSARFANALRQLGVHQGDRVAVQAEKSLHALALYLGCLRAGAVFLPLNTAYTPAEVLYFVEDARPRLVVASPQQAAALMDVTQFGATLVTLDASGGSILGALAQAASDSFLNAECDADHLAAILYTSGTTGRSKGAMLSHGNLLSNAEVLASEWRFTSDDVLLHALPIFHAHGLFVGVNVALLAGASMLFLPRFAVEEVIRLMPRSTVFMGVPTFYTRLIDHARLPQASRAMRLFVSGSAPLRAETHEAWQQRTGHAILERYGMTETVMLTSNPYDGSRVPGSVGLPLPGVSARIADPVSGAVLENGAIGMIEVRGPNVFSGYWGMPERLESDFRHDGYFITGDLGRIDENGYFHIVGRDKDLIISGGYNVYPKEVETEIDAIEGVTESAVIGIPHPDFGEGVAAAVVCDADFKIDEQQILLAAEPSARGHAARHDHFEDSLGGRQAEQACDPAHL